MTPAGGVFAVAFDDDCLVLVDHCVQKGGQAGADVGGSDFQDHSLNLLKTCNFAPEPS